jgi:hypothetical protein
MCQCAVPSEDLSENTKFYSTILPAGTVSPPPLPPEYCVRCQSTFSALTIAGITFKHYSSSTCNCTLRSRSPWQYHRSISEPEVSLTGRCVLLLLLLGPLLHTEAQLVYRLATGWTTEVSEFESR